MYNTKRNDGDRNTAKNIKEEPPGSRENQRNKLLDRETETGRMGASTEL